LKINYICNENPFQVIKTIKVSLKNFPVIPNLLRKTSTTPKDEIDVDLNSLFHHLYLDTYGDAPPNPNPAYGLYSTLVTNESEFRFKKHGLGSHKEAKVGERNKLGKAFCRWFLNKFCKINYFAHIDDILDKPLIHKSFSKLKITKISKGDAPDYFCAKNSSTVYLAEAKGTSKSLNFGTKKFNKWRKQFNTVALSYLHGRISVKGYIVATRLVTEDQSKNAKTKILVEDPRTKGNEVSDDNRGQIGQTVLALHYSYSLQKIQLPLLSSSLRDGLLLPEELKIPVLVWKCLVNPLKDIQFVGVPIGYPFVNFDPFFLKVINENTIRHLFLNVTFFGIKMETFEKIRKATVSGNESLNDLIEFETEKYTDSPPYMSILSDATVLAPIHYFKFEKIVDL
jgi:hypothetical protein